MKIERRFSQVSSHTWKYIRINWNWNHSLSEVLGIIQSNSLSRNLNRNFSRSHPSTGSTGFAEGGKNWRTSSLTQQTSEGRDVSWSQHRGVIFLLFECLTIKGLAGVAVPCSLEDSSREFSEAPERRAKELEERTWCPLPKRPFTLAGWQNWLKSAEIISLGKRRGGRGTV